jgi:DNA-binding PadR family transcriptional regulator
MSHEEGRDLQKLPGVVEYYILLALLHAPWHGLGIFESVAQRTSNQLILAPGTLYAVLKRMYQEGWIELAHPPVTDQPEHDQRNYYQLTSAGHQILQNQIAWMEAELARIYADRVQVPPDTPTADEGQMEEEIDTEEPKKRQLRSKPAGKRNLPAKDSHQPSSSTRQSITKRKTTGARCTLFRHTIKEPVSRS